MNDNFAEEMSAINTPNDISGDVPDVVNLHVSGCSQASQDSSRESNIHICQSAASSSHQLPVSGPLNAAVILKTRQNHELSPCKSNSHNTSKYVKLNVGGSLHYTTMGTLTKEDNMLRAMFSGRMEVLTDSEGWILIDRCGKHFGTILNYLRDGSIVLPDSRYEIAELLAEAKYYLIQGLITQCDQALRQKSMELDPICRVPLVTSIKEEQELVKRTNKPVVKFMYNRSNNKYSYTSSSDDNMLKNIELFDKLSLRFNGRILFMKDTIGDEICQWSFYGRRRKVAEICCTSIVYATEKKQTKVEFPEARIYEETLNILLYEKDKHGVCMSGHHPECSCGAGIDYILNKSGHHMVVNHCQSDDETLDEGRPHRVRRIHVNSNRPT
ncbi:BTB/POZ domain-containing adapter for CUL3-mediated RhoA degradation protein 3-like [Styela clava]|uniref:BTB/POZ domain-containing adapter for CUL3-mediated RhoA degradation protein 3-like n=1 Tax=Styela clava TaxID=7725 RepID=UPI001939D059|nr:BTB/POZ domain-containing adapter for CUL3-mediated RhoA degradation protein 3-like [Styela clava]